MKNINEFINNKETEFDILDKKLFMETAHLSNLEMISENKYFKIILNKGDEFLPFIVEKIINDCSIFAHWILINKITGIERFTKNGLSFKDSVNEWWNENKYKYE